MRERVRIALAAAARRGAPRTLALMGGTTTLADCFVAATYLALPFRLVRGGKLDEYERAFARQVGVPHACSFSSGRVGLYGILRALGFGPGDEVLLQVPTHIVVEMVLVSSVLKKAARPKVPTCLPS